MKLRTILETLESTLNRISQAVRRMAKREVQLYYNPKSSDTSLSEDLYQEAMIHLINFLRSSKAEQYSQNDAYLLAIARNAMKRAGLRSQGTIIGRMTQVAPLPGRPRALRKAEYDPTDESELDVDKYPKKERQTSEETEIMREIIAKLPEHSRFIINLHLDGLSGPEIADLEAKKYGRPSPVSRVMVKRWIDKLKEVIKRQLANNDIL